jgi:hypothetical protein
LFSAPVFSFALVTFAVLLPVAAAAGVVLLLLRARKRFAADPDIQLGSRASPQIACSSFIPFRFLNFFSFFFLFSLSRFVFFWFVCAQVPIESRMKDTRLLSFEVSRSEDGV